MATTAADGGDRGWPDLFEDRYGQGAYECLIALLDQPCVTFANIAGRFGVTRERVRQWHLRLRPDAPRGHARQHLCSLQQRKRALFDDPLFRSFYRHARAHFQPKQLSLVPARGGFRKRTVKLDGQVIGLRQARPSTEHAYTLAGAVTPADFLYYRLNEHDYLFVPRRIVPAAGATYQDAEHSQYFRFRNTFHAALTPSFEATHRV